MDGLLLGSLDGFVDGLLLGKLLGLLDGCVDGLLLGKLLGVLDGFVDGLFDGLVVTLGLLDGLVVIGVGVGKKHESKHSSSCCMS